MDMCHCMRVRVQLSLSKQQDVLALLEEDKVDKETATYTQAHKHGTPHSNPASPHTSAAEQG